MKINFLTNLPSRIFQIVFLDPAHGYLTAYTYAGNFGNVYETDDSGYNWHQLFPYNFHALSVYTSKHILFVTADTSNSRGYYPIPTNFYFTHDDGLTWDSITTVPLLPKNAQPTFGNLSGNKDSLIITVWRIPDSLYLIYSTNLGNSWDWVSLGQSSEWYKVGASGGAPVSDFFSFSHECNALRLQRGWREALDDVYSIMSSSLPFTKYDSLLRAETGGWIAGNACAQYISSASDISLGNGLMRSTTQGIEWTAIGGPDCFEIDDLDYTNISVVGYGAIVYASGPNGDLWKTTDGGDGTLSATALAPQMALAHAAFPSGTDTLQVMNCEQSQMLVTNFNIGCSWATFDSVTLAGIDPSEYSVTSTHYCGCTHVPDTSFITLAPKQIGIRYVTVHFHYTDDEFNHIDTTLSVTLDVQSGGVAVPMSLSLGSGAMVAHAGDTIEIPVYLSSDSSITLSGIASIILPFALDTNVLKVLSFDPAVAGTTIGGITYGESAGSVPLQVPNLTIRGRTLIGSLRCVVYLADTLATSVSLAGASINVTGVGCIALSTQEGAVNIAITGCGDSTLLHFMQDGKIPLGIRSISPNPTSGSVTVIFENPTSEAISYRVFDVLGIVCAEGMASNRELMLDVRSLPAGLYYLRASCGRGAVASGRFIVER